VLEDDENAQMLVGREAVVGAGLDEDCCPFTNGNVVPLHLENARAFENHVELVVLVRLLTVRLGRDEDVDTDLEAFGRVHNLVSAPGVGKPLLDRGDLERVHGETLLQGPHTRVPLRESGDIRGRAEGLCGKPHQAIRAGTDGRRTRRCEHEDVATNGSRREELPRAAEVTAYLWIIAILLSVLEVAWWICNRIVAP
jgi:hypothetical protein